MGETHHWKIYRIVPEKAAARRARELVIPIGAPGSGKTSYLREHYPDHEVVSPDLIRFEKLDSWNTGVFFDPKVESDVWAEAYSRLARAMEAGKDVVFDATNPTKGHRYPLVGRARVHKYEVVMVVFNIPLEVLLGRNGSRDDGRSPVPDRALARIFSRLEYPEVWEYDRLVTVGTHGRYES